MTDYTNEQVALMAAVEGPLSRADSFEVLQAASSYLEWLDNQTRARLEREVATL